MLVILASFLIIVLIFAQYRYRNVLCPAVLHNFFWVISILGAISFPRRNEISPWAVFIIVVGAIIFQVGFSFSIHSTVGHNKRPINYQIYVNSESLKVLVIIIFVISLPILLQYYNYLKHSSTSLYEMLKGAEDQLQLPSTFEYFRKSVQAIAIGFLAIYWQAEEATRKSIKKYIILLFLLAILSVASAPSRNSILFFILPLFVLYTTTHDVSDKKIVALGLALVVVFMAMFYLISLGKYWYLYNNTTNRFSVISKEIQTYLSGSIVGFGINIENHSYQYLGKNTFRFFYAFADRLFGTSNAVRLVNEYTSLGNGMSTNVYTFYDFYLRDYGFLYALIAQFIVAFLHGISYKGMLRNDLLQIYYYAFLSYPLVLQFFQDQYLSLFSNWLQIIIIGIIIFRTNLFVRVVPIYEQGWSN